MQFAERLRTEIKAEQKKVALWFAAFVVVSAMLILVVAASWYYWRGRDSKHERQIQSQLVMRKIALSDEMSTFRFYSI